MHNWGSGGGGERLTMGETCGAEERTQPQEAGPCASYAESLADTQDLRM